MTIASQIQDYADGLDLAYTAISGRGGTIPARKNMDNLPTAINSIPSGGQTKDYGTLLVAPMVMAATAEYASDCTVVVNASAFNAAYPTYELTYGLLPWYFSYDSTNDVWNVGSTTASASDLATLGITVSGVQSWSSFYLVQGDAPDLDHPVSEQLTDEYEYKSLSNLIAFYDDYNNKYVNDYFLLGGEKIERSRIVGYSFGSDCDSVPERFLEYCPMLNSTITFPSGITRVPDYFLYNCSGFKSSVVLPNSVTNIGNYYLNGSGVVHADIPANVTNVGVYCLQGCLSLEDITLHDGVTAIGASFAAGCTSLVTLNWSGVTSLTTIGNNFLGQCTSFNDSSAGNIPSSVTSITGNYLAGCSSFNQNVVLPASLSSTGTNFLSSCTSFNSSVTFSSQSTEVGNYFLAYCTSFNKPIALPTSITSFGTYFLRGCTSFNQPITFPSTLKTIGMYFLYQCTAFNQPITIHSGITAFNGGQTLYNNAYFLYGCTSFDSTITIQSRSTRLNLTNYFLYGCTNYTQPLTIPENVSPGSYFMYNCTKFVGPLQYESSIAPSSNSYSLSTNSNTALMYTTGVTVTGSKRSSAISVWTNRTSSPYRKIIDGGA